MSLSAAEIALVIEEIAPAWSGAQVQKVHMRGPAVALLGLRAPGRSGVLVLSVDPGAAAVCVVDARGPVDPEPSAFCMLLRRLLRGRRLEAIEQLEGDRVVAARGPEGALVAEMTGRRGRLVALDAGGLVVATSPASARGGGPAGRLARGAPYAAPPSGGAVGGAPRLVPGLANAGAAALAGVGPGEAAEEAAEGLRRALRRALSAGAKRARRARQKVEADLEKAGDPEEMARGGELLKAEMSRVRRGMRSLVVVDPGSDEPVEIPLDPSLGAKGNLEAIFKRARRARRTRAAAAERLEALRAEEARAAAGLERLEDAGPAELEALAAELDLALEAGGPGRRRGRRELERRPYHEFRDGRGRPILVGRSAGDNDSLTQKVARPTDLWLHARGRRGAHVVVPLEKGEGVEPDRLVDAATLAAHYSEARDEETVEIAYTSRRYVRKPKGAPPGEVALLREKVMLLALEPARLARLLRNKR